MSSFKEKFAYKDIANKTLSFEAVNLALSKVKSTTLACKLSKYIVFMCHNELVNNK